jgi:hypothetical protein
MAMKAIDVWLNDGTQHTLLPPGPFGLNHDRYEIHEEDGFNGMVKFIEMRGHEVLGIRAYPKNAIKGYYARNY